MTKHIEIEVMKNAYGRMYLIENSLRKIILEKMRVSYGSNWYKEAPLKEKRLPHKKAFESLNFHDLISFLVVYPCLSSDISKKTISYLRQLIPIRNKIAHHMYLTSEESILLYNNHKRIMTDINKIKKSNRL